MLVQEGEIQRVKKATIQTSKVASLIKKLKNTKVILCPSHVGVTDSIHFLCYIF